MVPRILNLINTELQVIRKANQYDPPVQVEVVYGNRAIESTSVTPRIVWTFSGGNISPTKHLGVNPHQAKSIEADVTCHMFHKSPDDVLNLLNDVMVATRIVMCEPSIIKASFEFVDPGENYQNGFCILLNLTLDVTLIDPVTPYVTVNTVNPTATFLHIQPS